VHDTDGWWRQKRGLRDVRVPHPDTREQVPVTRQDSLQHAEADHRVLQAAERCVERRAAWRGRLIRALRPYVARHTSAAAVL